MLLRNNLTKKEKSRMKLQHFTLGLMLSMVMASQVSHAYDLQASVASSSATTTDSLNERIRRVEQGLSTLVVVKDAPKQTMTLAERMRFYQVPAVSIAVVNNGQIEWARAYGVTQVGGKQAVTPNTLFQAGSVSKPVSALAALHLVEQGKLQLDGDVNQQLRTWHLPDNEFTKDKKASLRHLLNHSAGVNVHGFYGYPMSQKVPSLLDVLDGKPPANSEPVRVTAVPRSAWKYSGGGYSIIQLMMIEASQKSFPQLMQETLFAPLKMTRSLYAERLPTDLQKDAAVAHRGDGKAVDGLWHQYPELTAAGLWSTPFDLAKVIIEVQKAEAGQSNKVLSSPMTKTMLTRVMGETGLGFYVEQLADRTSFSHSGGTDGFRTLLYGYTKTGQGAVVMVNSDNGAALFEEIFASIAAEYNWPEFTVTQKATIPADAVLNKQLAGEFSLLNEPATIVAEGEQLYFQSKLLSAKPVRLYRESTTRFFATAPDITISFELDTQARVTGFSLLNGTSTYPATRVK